MSTHRARDFWRRMAERMGQRWYDERGTQPNNEWATLLTGYSDAVIAGFFANMPPYEHPPTHPMVAREFENIERRGADDARDHARGYWRSCVKADMECAGRLAGLWPYGTPLHLVTIDIRPRVLRFAVELADELYNSEKQIGSRTSAMTDYCTARCWTYAQQLAGELRQRAVAPIMARGAA